MHGGSSASLVDERLTTKAKIGAWLKSVGALFARSSWRHRAAPHAATCRKRTCRRKIVPLKQAVWKMGENIEWHIFLFSLYAVNETAIVASEKRSNLLKQKNGATISGIICLSVYDWIMQINRSSAQVRQGIVQWLSTGMFTGLFHAGELNMMTVWWHSYSKWAVQMDAPHTQTTYIHIPYCSAVCQLNDHTIPIIH